MGLTENEAAERGLMKTWVYRCVRCLYSWLPRDFDPAFDDIETMEPPKSCARCKSKYWRVIPSREIKHSIEKVGSVARKRALLRSRKSKSKTVIVKTKDKTPISSQTIGLKPYESSKKEGGIDKWEPMCLIPPRLNVEDPERLFEHRYKKWSGEDDYLIEVLRINDNGRVDVLEISFGASHFNFYDPPESPSDEECDDELTARREYWKTHKAPKRLIKKIVKKVALLES